MNKEFDDRYTTLKNRIEILKREEKIYKNQLKIIKMKEQKEQRIQIDKIKLRLELNKVKEEQDKELLKRKERAYRIKERTKNNMEQKKKESLSKKKIKYQSALNDKYLIKCIIEQMNDQQTNRKCYQHEKVRQYYNEYETNKIKKNLIKENKQRLDYENNMKALIEKERNIKRKYEELESEEKLYLEKLNETKASNLRYMENTTTEYASKYSYGYLRKIHGRNLNRSMELESLSRDKKTGESKSVLSCSVKNINNLKNMKNKNDKKDNVTAHTQRSSSNIYKTSNTGKNKLNIKINHNSAIKRRNQVLFLDNKKISKTFVKKDNTIEKNIKNKTNNNLKKQNINNNKKRNDNKDSYANIAKNKITKVK